MLVWMDLEMTGLDATHDTIVEIATLVTDDNLVTIAEGPDLVVATPPDALAGMDDFVRSMHTKSGLLEAIGSATISLAEAGAATLEFIRTHVPKPRTVPLAGNSIGTDRRFLTAYLPDIENYLHYRSVDVSTVKELARRWHPEVLAGAPAKVTAHRAMDDIKESIAELAYYRATLFRPTPAAVPEPAAAPQRSDPQPDVPPGETPRDSP
ncbi:MAG: oligoribonuclease [Acidimicrobiales bacterium]